MGLEISLWHNLRTKIPHLYVEIYIYIYIQRERERHTHTHTKVDREKDDGRERMKIIDTTSATPHPPPSFIGDSWRS